MMGTPAYMAPEQVLGREIDGRADLYSVGVVLYRLLSGHLPFKADTAISMVQMQISEPPTPIAAFRPDLPRLVHRDHGPRARASLRPIGSRAPRSSAPRSIAAAAPQGLGEMPTLATPTPPGLPLDPGHDGTSSARRRRCARPRPSRLSGEHGRAGDARSLRRCEPAVAAAPTPTNTPLPRRPRPSSSAGRT